MRDRLIGQMKTLGGTSVGGVMVACEITGWLNNTFLRVPLAI